MKDNITIGLFIDTFFPMVDGVITVVDNYAKRLAKKADVVVFAPKVFGKKFDDKTLPYKVVRCKSMKFSIIDYSLPIPKFDRKFKKELSNYKLDIVHIHSPFMVGKMGINYAKKHNIPVVATMHSQFKKDLKRAVKFDFLANRLNNTIIKTFNKCDECWAVNNEVARIFYEDYGYKEMPKVMNNATDMIELKDKEELYNKIDKEFKIKDDEKVFLFVGRINSLKNVFFTVDSLKRLKEIDPDMKFKMLFIGKGQDEKALKEKVREYGMQNEIKFCGKIVDKEMLAGYYSRADLFLFPSLYDASSIVQIEAASQRTPVVFLKGAATTGTVTNNVNGFIAENSVDAYANKIIEVMNDKKLYKEVSNNCYRDLYKNWDMTIDEVYEKYLNLAKKVV